jgi:hypothetical protein
MDSIPESIWKIFAGSAVQPFFPYFSVRILYYRSICFSNTLGTTEVLGTCALFVDFSTTEVPRMLHVNTIF